MPIDDPFERTPNLVAKIRKLREVAEKEMNQFTDAADYDVRRLVGQKPKAERREETAPPAASATGSAKRRPFRPPGNQVAIEFSTDPRDHGGQQEEKNEN